MSTSRLPSLLLSLSLTSTLVAAAACADDPGLGTLNGTDQYKDPTVYTVQLVGIELDDGQFASVGESSAAGFYGKFNVHAGRHSYETSNGGGEFKNFAETYAAFTGPTAAMQSPPLLTNATLLSGGGISLELTTHPLFGSERTMGYCEYTVDPASLPAETGTLTFAASDCGKDPWLDSSEVAYPALELTAIKSATFQVSRVPLAARSPSR